MNAIELRDVTARYSGAAVLRNVDLAIRPSEVAALLGPNGAGKTTVVRTVCGVAPEIRGAVLLLDRDVTRDSPRVRARMGLRAVTDDRGLFTQLTVRENLRVGIRGESPVPIESWFPELPPLFDRPAGVLSGGEQTMLALARAMISRPRVLVVDELTTGLAPAFAGAAMAVLRRAADEWGTGVLLVEQSAELALETADRAYVLRRGEVAFSGPAADVRLQGDLLESTYLGEMS